LKKLLLISYKSPPILSAPSDRIYGFAKYLPAFGWKTFLLTVKNPFPWDLRFDRELYRPLDNLHVIRAVDLQLEVPYYALKKLGVDPRVFFAFDETLGWIPHACFIGKKLIEKEQIDCILASHPPPSTLIVGSTLANTCRVPLVLDYRDPWNSSVAHPSSLHRKLEMSIENTILMRSDGIVTVCNTVKDMLLDDFPSAREKRLEIVRNGFLSDILGAERHTFTDHKIRILHAGSIYGERVLHMLSFLKALEMLSNEIGSLGDRLSVILTGHVDSKIVDHVRKSNLDSVVSIMNDMPRQEIWGYMKGVEYLLCIPGWRQTLTWKIFEYLAAGKPILNIGDENGEAADLIAKYHVGVTVRPDPTEIADFLRGLFRVPLTIKRVADVNLFSREKQTERLALFLNEIVERPKRNA
jgi:glycosyltransferase involved in cell wall biosynthesis